MQISDVTHERSGDRTRIAAKVIWEDCGRPPQDLYVETSTCFADGLTQNGSIFLIAGMLPAMRRGERRIAIDGEICPQLRLGLQNVMRLVQNWYGGPGPIAIEARTQGTTTHTVNRSAFFFTGGVDSLATLRVNQNLFPRTHPLAFRDGVIVFGLEVDRLEGFNHVLDVLGRLADGCGITMIPLYTNIRSLDDDWVFWTDQFESSVLAAAAHTLERRLSSAWIASSYDYPHLHPHGSHPLLDLQYSSASLRIVHDGMALSRLDKVRILADWPQGIRSLHVCNRSERYAPGVINCGACEKCLRTLSALLVIDRLDDAHSFASRQVSAELLATQLEMTPAVYPFWSELVEPLERTGHVELARFVRSVVKAYETNGGWKGTVERLDRRFLGGALLRVRDVVRQRSPRLNQPATETPG